MIGEVKAIPDYNQERFVLRLYAIIYVGTRNNMNRRSIPSVELNKFNNRGKIIL